MKSIFTLLLLFLPFFGNSQTPYNEFTVPNFTPMETFSIEIEKEECFYILTHQFGLITRNYILINRTGSVFTQPTLPTGWNLSMLYKPNKAIFTFSIGANYTVVHDNFYNTYMRIN